MNYFLKLRNLVLFVLALFSVVRYGKRVSMPEHPRTVLVIHLAKLGDMVCFTPVLRALRTHLPQVKIIVLGDAVNRALLEGNKDVDEYVLFSEKDIFSAIRSLGRMRVDVAIVRGTGFVGLAMALIAGIPSILTFRLAQGKSFATRTYDRLLPYVRTVDTSFGEYMPRQYLRLLEPLGIMADDTKKHLVFSDRAEANVQQFLKDRSLDQQNDFIVGISPSAGNKIKEWPTERFAVLADHLIETHAAKILLIGGPKDHALIREVETHVRNKSFVSSTGEGLSIDDLKALIAKLNLFISVDTGPVYIAEAFGVPTVDIVGPVDEREQPPRGPFHRVVVPQRKEAEVHILNARLYDPKEAARQTLSISVEAVCTEVDGLLADMRQPHVL